MRGDANHHQKFPFEIAVNAHIIGSVMKEMVGRAISIVHSQRHTFTAETKIGKTGLPDDVVTSADKEAQAMYVRLITERFPGYGIIAEEEGLQVRNSIPGRRNLFFTVDPLDGTKAYKRRQSFGISTMLSLVDGQGVIAAYVGDCITGEIYGYRPGSQKAHYIDPSGYHRELKINSRLLLNEQYVLLRDHPTLYSSAFAKMAEPNKKNGLFENIEVGGGSIGISFSRLWKGEVGAIMLGPGKNNLWDLAPIYGISEQLGFTFLIGEALKAGSIETFSPSFQPQEETGEILVVHQSRVQELQAWTWQQ